MHSTLTRSLGWAAVGAAAGWLAITAVRAARQIDFRGKVALVTGGSRGLGLLLARRLAMQGAKVAICARNGEELQSAKDDLARYSEHVMAIECDITYPAEIEAMMHRIGERLGSVEILINNAGTIQVGPQEEMTLEDYRYAMDVHYWGPLHTIGAVLPHMRRRGQGRIVNIASIGGIISVPHLNPYSGSKFALVGLSEGLRSELLREGIYVTTVCPGLMRTGSHLNAQFKGKHSLECAWFSLAASLPVASMSADRAADQVLAACRSGRAHVVLSLPAQLVSLAHGVAPSLVSESLAVVNRLLPGGGGIGALQIPGFSSRPAWLPSFLTYLGDQAAVRNNELSLEQQSKRADGKPAHVRRAR